MKILFVYPFFIFISLSCMKDTTQESAKIKKSGASKITNQNEKGKDCDSGEEVLKKIEVRKDSLSLNNLESGCSIDSNKDEELKL